MIKTLINIPYKLMNHVKNDGPGGSNCTKFIYP